jgi:hypothetical protein
MKPFFCLMVATLSGCASLPAGLEMTQEEQFMCEVQHCTVWSDTELKALILKVWREALADRKNNI